MNLETEKSRKEQEMVFLKETVKLDAEKAQIGVDAVAKKAQAVTPQLIAALTNLGDRQLAIKVAEAMAPLAIVEDSSVAESLNKLLRGSSLENILASSNLLGGGENRSA